MRRIGDTLYDVLDQHTGEYFTYAKVLTYEDGSQMADNLCDGVMYRSKGGEFFKRNFTGAMNVKWFGAKGDGITDDTAAIQKAVNAAIERRGGRIFFPAGKYLVTDSIYVLTASYSGNTPMPIMMEGESYAYQAHYDVAVNIIGATDIMFKVNIKHDGSSGLTDPIRQFTGFEARNMNFIGADGFDPIVFQIFRARFYFENLTCYNVLGLIDCIQKDANNNTTYCDMSIVRNIRSRFLKGVLISTYYADATTIENIYCEKALEGVKHVIVARSSEGLKISNVLCSGNPEVTPVAGSAMIQVSDSTVEVSNFYVEHQSAFDFALVLSQCRSAILTNISERFNGRTFVRIYKSNVKVNGYRTWSTRYDGYSDIEIVGNATDVSTLALNNSGAFRYEDGVAQPNAIEREMIINPVGGLVKFTDDDKYLKVFWTGTEWKITDFSGKDVSAKYGTPTLEDGERLSFPSLRNHNNLNISNPIRYREFTVQKAHVSDVSNWSYRPSLQSRTLGGAFGVYFIDEEYPLSNFYSDGASTGTSFSTLYNTPIDANTLLYSGAKIEASFSGTVALNGAANSGLALNFGGVQVWSSANFSTSAAGTFQLDMELFRTGPTTGRLVVRLKSNVGGLTGDPTFVSLNGLDYTTATNLILQGKGEVANSVVAKSGSVKYKPHGFRNGRRQGITTPDRRMAFEILLS